MQSNFLPRTFCAFNFIVVCQDPQEYFTTKIFQIMILCVIVFLSFFVFSALIGTMTGSALAATAEVTAESASRCAFATRWLVVLDLHPILVCVTLTYMYLGYDTLIIHPSLFLTLAFIMFFHIFVLACIGCIVNYLVFAYIFSNVYMRLSCMNKCQSKPLLINTFIPEIGKFSRYKFSCISFLPSGEVVTVFHGV